MPRGQHLSSTGVVVLLMSLGAAVAAAPLSTTLPGDANCDQHVDAADIGAVIDVIFGAPDVCAAADVNGDGGVTTADVTGVVLGLRFSPPSPTATVTPTTTSSPTPTQSPLSSETPAMTGTPATSATPTASATVTRTSTTTATPTLTGTPTASATATVPLTAGPIITFFGLAAASGKVLPPDSTDPQGIPTYQLKGGSGFVIVVESKPGQSGNQPGVKLSNSDPSDPSARPDIQIEANRDLGNGSAAVCDAGPKPNPIGGVPGINPPSFDPASQKVADALNDLGCRFAAHIGSDPCTLDAHENPAFAGKGTAVQMCSSPVFGHETVLQSGATLFTMQWRDTAGNLSLQRQLVVSVP